jgi:hypothetical protein
MRPFESEGRHDTGEIRCDIHSTGMAGAVLPVAAGGLRDAG